VALKKSELYSSLWASCDELRGGMDASQYKDYVLVLLFIKYVSDKYAGQVFAPITVPPGASFKDMVALKGKSDIGDQINKHIVAPLFNANQLSDPPDFNDPAKLGTGKEDAQAIEAFKKRMARPVCKHFSRADPTSLRQRIRPVVNARPRWRSARPGPHKFHGDKYAIF
jgi:type I restriction-modification system DNA methylase subunit